MNWFWFTGTDGDIVTVNLAQCICVNFFEARGYAEICPADSGADYWRISRPDDVARLRVLLFRK
jgi:hypothetical protein